MTKRWWIPALGILVAGAALVYGKMDRPENGFTLLQCHNADAKFLGDRIITSVNENIQILDLEGNVLHTLEGAAASWLYAAEDLYEETGQKVVAYSNHANETRILKLSKSDECLSDVIAVKSDTLAIDPILVKLSDGFLLTNTEIEGTINNPDPNGENGTYTVKMYRSEDLEHWDYAGDIVSQKKNTEDGDIRYVDGVLYYFFEEEDYDKGPSKLKVLISRDEGETWGEEKTLLSNDSDHEMASCEWDGQKWRLYFSCDLANPGKSYQGANVYYADFDDEFHPIGECRRSSMPDNQSVRLYEAKELEGQTYFLFARNYLTDCDLLLRIIENEN